MDVHQERIQPTAAGPQLAGKVQLCQASYSHNSPGMRLYYLVGFILQRTKVASGSTQIQWSCFGGWREIQSP